MSDLFADGPESLRLAAEAEHERSRAYYAHESPDLARSMADAALAAYAREQKRTVAKINEESCLELLRIRREEWRSDNREAVELLRDYVNFVPFSQHFDHSGFMNATQLAERDSYLKLRARAIALLSGREGA